MARNPRRSRPKPFWSVLADRLGLSIDEHDSFLDPGDFDSDGREQPPRRTTSHLTPVSVAPVPTLYDQDEDKSSFGVSKEVVMNEGFITKLSQK